MTTKWDSKSNKYRQLCCKRNDQFVALKRCIDKSKNKASTDLKRTCSRKTKPREGKHVVGANVTREKRYHSMYGAKGVSVLQRIGKEGGG